MFSKVNLVTKPSFCDGGWYLRNVTVRTGVPPSPVILWTVLDGKPKWLLLNCGYHDAIRKARVSHLAKKKITGGNNPL